MPIARRGDATGTGARRNTNDAIASDTNSIVSTNEDYVRRVEFDATVEEIVDVQIRLAYDTKTLARQRQRQMMWTGLGIALGTPITFFYRIDRSLEDPLPISLLFVVVTIGVVLGIAGAYITGWFFDRRVRRYVRSTLDERLSGEPHIKVELEIRPEGAWCRSRGVEMTVPWSQLTRVANPEDGVELWFSTPALVRIPSRVFKKDDERTAIVQRVTALAGRVAKPA